ncbi:MAG TPA: BON domain-containing protein [Stellaceae bacterium]|nr:BON domain-containing protein [Stellaceae bacterium]
MTSEKTMSHDQRLEQEVLAELAWKPSATEAHTGIGTSGAVVTLSGQVEGLVEQYVVGTATATVRMGARAVTEEIEVRLRFDIKRGDEEIAAAAMHRLACDASVPRDAVKVKVEKGWIILTGQVDWRSQKEAAAQDVHGLFGVVGVSDQITIKQRGKASNAGRDNGRAFHRSWFFDPKAVTLSAEGERIRLVASREYWKFEGGITP